MRSLRPYRPSDSRRLELAGDLSWWRLDAEPGYPAADAAAGAATAQSGWVARLQGDAEAVMYAAGVAGHDAVELRRGGRHRAEARLVDIDGGAAAALLDAASQTGLTVELRRPADAARGGTVAIRVDGGASWAALGMPSTASRTDLARLAHALRAELRSDPAPEAAAEQPDRQRASRDVRSFGSPRVLAAALAALVVAAGTGGVLWSRAHTTERTTAQTAAATPPTVTAPFPGLDVPIRDPSTLPATTLPSTPSARFGAAIAYDPARREVLMFGGVDGYSETWVWRPAVRWILQSSGSTPQGRFGASLAYNPDTGAIFMFGGRTQDGELPSDTWVWTGGWTPACLCAFVPGGSAVPPGQEFAPMAFDAINHQLVLVTTNNDVTQTWVWGPGGSWSPQSSAGTPPAPQAMAWDPASRSLILVSQVLNADGTPAGKGQTWSWDGHAWHRLADLPEAILTVGSGGLALDPQTGHLVLVAARLTPATLDPRTNMHTWTWDGGTWTYVAPAPDGVAGLASDPVDHELLAFGPAGGDIQRVHDVFAWSGAFWVPLV
jgi:hypothetical protein